VPDLPRPDLLAPIAALLDQLLPPDAAREAKLRLLGLDRDGGLDPLRAELRARLLPPDAWTARARPGFLFVMYGLLLWSVPVGLLAAIRPSLAEAVARGTAAYLQAIPEPLYALFGTGYLGYTAARTWAKVRERRQ
jgi:hypothetical protein